MLKNKVLAVLGGLAVLAGGITPTLASAHERDEARGVELQRHDARPVGFGETAFVEHRRVENREGRRDLDQHMLRERQLRERHERERQRWLHAEREHRHDRGFDRDDRR